MSQNTATVETYLDGFCRNDHAQILSCLTDDIEWTVFGAFHLIGKQAYDEAVEGPGFSGPPRLDVVRMVEQDDVVMAALRGEATRDTEAALPTFAQTRKQLPGPLGAYTSVEACAEALVENLETRGRRVFVPGSVGVISALRQLVTGVVAEKVAMKVSAKRVPQLERDILALNGQEFGKNSVGETGRKPAA